MAQQAGQHARHGGDVQQRVGLPLPCTASSWCWGASVSLCMVPWCLCMTGGMVSQPSGSLFQTQPACPTWWRCAAASWPAPPLHSQLLVLGSLCVSVHDTLVSVHDGRNGQPAFGILVPDTASMPDMVAVCSSALACPSPAQPAPGVGEPLCVCVCGIPLFTCVSVCVAGRAGITLSGPVFPDQPAGLGGREPVEGSTVGPTLSGSSFWTQPGWLVWRELLEGMTMSPTRGLWGWAQQLQGLRACLCIGRLRAAGMCGVPHVASCQCVDGPAWLRVRCPHGRVLEGFGEGLGFWVWGGCCSWPAVRCAVAWQAWQQLSVPGDAAL